jgi:hydrogenase small subunit
MALPADGLYAALVQRGLSRRTFLKLGAAMATALALPLDYAAQITRAVEAAPRIPLVWLHGLACGGETQAFMQSSSPTTTDLLIQTLSVEYEPHLAAGTPDPANAYPDGFVLVVDGAIPTADQGVYATVGGRSVTDIVRDLAPRAKATIAVGSCAFDGGASAASGGLVGAVGVGSVVGGANLVNLPGCPVNVENLAATFVHYLTFGALPPTDSRGRPYFAYGGLIHNQCERRPHFEYGEFVTSWGDEGAQKGWCLYKMGCKGPQTFANCPTVKYADAASWSVLAGHPCIGCTSAGFWDAMGSAYDRLPAPIAYAPDITVDQIGAVMVGGVAAMTVVHGGASTARQWRNRRSAARRLGTTAAPLDAEPAASAPLAETDAGSTTDSPELPEIEPEPAPDAAPGAESTPDAPDDAEIQPESAPDAEPVALDDAEADQ